MGVLNTIGKCFSCIFVAGLLLRKQQNKHNNLITRTLSIVYKLLRRKVKILRGKVTVFFYLINVIRESTKELKKHPKTLGFLNKVIICVV
jgi:hypothetical protein